MDTHVDSIFEHDLVRHALVSRRPATRLVIFVHGWRGDATSSWGGFYTPPNDDWWQDADLVFVQYDSTAETVTATSDRIRRQIGDFFPVPYKRMLVDEEGPVRADFDSPYDELVLVGHSLGGLVLRRALVDSMHEWRASGYRAGQRPVILEAALRLFSPASAGFQPRGLLGAFKSAPLWWIAEMFLTSGAYPDLQRGSVLIKQTQDWTEAYGGDGRASALAASILWANPERVVITDRYETDARTQTADKTTHSSVCKPSDKYTLPYRFVQKGCTD